MKKLMIPAAIAMCLGTGAIAGEGYEDATTSVIDREAAATVFIELDADADGMLSEAEAGELASMQNLYVELDADADGLLSEDEFTVMADWDADLSDDRMALVTDVQSRITTEATAFTEDDTDDLAVEPGPDVFDTDWEETNQDDALAAETTVEGELEIADDDTIAADTEAEVEGDLAMDAEEGLTADTSVEVESDLDTGFESDDSLAVDTSAQVEDEMADEGAMDESLAAETTATTETDVESDIDEDALAADTDDFHNEEINETLASEIPADLDTDLDTEVTVDAEDAESSAELEVAAEGVIAEETVTTVFADLDANDDGMLDAAEAAELTTMTDLYVELDADADGSLSEEEFAAMADWEADLSEDRMALVTEVQTHVSVSDETTAFTADDTSDLAVEPGPDTFDTAWEETSEPDAAAETTIEVETVAPDVEDDTLTADTTVEVESDLDTAMEEDTLAVETSGEIEGEFDAATPMVDHETVTFVFDDLDANDDDLLNEAEAATLVTITPVYVELDADADGNISRDEFIVMSDWEADLSDDRMALVTEVQTYQRVDSDTTTAYTEPSADFDSDLDIEDDDAGNRQ